MTPRLAIATHNAHKVGEIWAIVAPHLTGLRREAVVAASDLGAPSPVEDGISFVDNALIKARALAASSGLPAIADDSGIAVDVMGGMPGIFSAIWSGQHGADGANVDLLLAQMSDIPDHHRGAAFVCAAVLVTPEGHEVVCEGRQRGILLRERRGEHGFGYDPIFLGQGQRLSNAQLDADAKNAISHRGAAFRELAPRIGALIGS